MLKRLFSRGSRRPAALAANPDAATGQRLAAIASLDASQASDSETLAALAADGNAPAAVRSAAIARLARVEALQALLDEADVSRPAAARLLELLPADQLRAEVVKRPPLARALLARPDSDPELGALAFSTLTANAADCVALATADAAPQWRQRAVEALVDESHLAEVVRSTRNRDKRTHRAARERLEALRGFTQRDAAIADELTRLAERMTALAARPPDNLQRREAEHIESRWQSLLQAQADNVAAGAAFNWQPAVLDAIHASFAQARTTLQTAIVDDTTAEPDSEPPQANGTQAEADAATDTDHESMAAAARSLASLRRSLEAGEFDPVRDLAAIDTALSLERSRFEAARGTLAGDAAVEAAFATDAAVIASAVAAARALRALPELPEIEPLDAPGDIPLDPERCPALWQARADSRRTRQRLERQLAEMHWPAVLPAPAALLEWRNRLHAMEAFEQRCDAHAAELERRLDAEQHAMHTHVEAGELASALAARSRGRDLLRALPRERQKRRQGEFDLLAARVEELRDWREFATHPKREQLCEAMEAHADNPAAPEQQASAVRELRSQWNALGAPRNASDHRLRERFDAAAERAFEPCRAWFESQAASREANAAARQQIVEQLEAFLASVDWASVNWKSIESILRTARRQWREYQPVPRKGAQAMGKRFGVATHAIDERLQAEYARNLRALEAIAAAAEAELEADTEVEARIDNVKRLQQRWQAVGVTPRRKQQALWKRFRAACDAVFAAREHARTAERSARRASADAATALCDELQAYLDDTPPAKLHASALSDFEQRFEALQDDPQTDAERGPRRASRHPARSSMRFAELTADFRARLAHRQRQQRLESARTLLQLALALAAAERGTGSAPDPQDLTSEQRRALADRLQALEDGQALAADTEATLDLAIEAEIIAGLESPTSDGERRMRVQVARLSRGLGGGEADPMDVVIDLIERWCAQPAPPQATAERFAAAIGSAIEDVWR